MFIGNHVSLGQGGRFPGVTRAPIPLPGQTVIFDYGEVISLTHVIHRASNPGARRVVPGQHDVGKAANHEDNEVRWSTNRGFRAER